MTTPATPAGTSALNTDPANPNQQTTPTNPTKSYFSEIKNSFTNNMSYYFNASKNKLGKCYSNSKKIVVQKLSDHLNFIIFSIAMTSLILCHPILSVLGAATGFYLTKKILEEKFPASEDASAANNVITPFNAGLGAVGAIGILLPPCSIAACAIIAGTFGIGNAAYNLYKKI